MLPFTAPLQEAAIGGMVDHTLLSVEAWGYNRAVKYTFVAITALICNFASAADNQLKKLNVAALDRQGEPVAGLQSGDFQVFEDGKAQKIAFFRFTGDHPPPAGKPAPGEYSNRSGATLRGTVILIDLLNDRVMSGSIINEEISRSLKNFESSAGLYLYILTASGSLYPIHPLPKPGSEATPGGEPPQEPWTRNIAPLLQEALKNVFSLRPVDEREVTTRFDLTMKALLEVGSQMRLLSGRTNLVWVTHGIPLYGLSIAEQGRVDFTNPLRKICQALAQAQIVVYPVEQSLRGAAAAMGTESDQSLDEFSGITGGRSYRSGGVGEAIQQAMTGSRANYQIAYYSGSVKQDGKHHKLRVTCARKEAHLETQMGFYILAPLASPADIERNAFEAALASPFDASEIGLRARVAADPSTKQNLRLEIRIDPADLLLRQEQDRRTGKVSLLFAAYGAAGLKQPGSTIPINIKLTAEQYETAIRDGIEFHQAIHFDETVRKVRVVVVDGEVGSAGSVTIPIVGN